MESPEYAQFLAVSGALGRLVILAFILERGLAFIFEHDWFRRLTAKKVPDPVDPRRQIWESRWPGMRETITLAVAVAICHENKFDLLAAVFTKPADGLGMTLTGFVAAGGSAGAIALFQGFLGMSRDAREAAIAARRTEKAASLEGAQAALELHRKQAAAIMRGRVVNTTDPTRRPGDDS